MDSRLKRIAIMTSAAMILLVSLLVLYLNGENNPFSGSPPIRPTEKPEVDESAGNGQIGSNLSAFLQDSTFFDPPVNPVLDDIKEKAGRLSMVLTSVEKDLRIQVVNVDGAPVEGESFFVELEGIGRYKDLDRDGVIYVGGLEAGEYSVRLLPIEGYHVPENGIKVRVKDKLEYRAISDISLLIRNEADIDAETEDTWQADAQADADRTEIKKLQKAAGVKVGIDVSGKNGNVDWYSVKRAGVEFAIIRVGYRGAVTGSLVEDSCFSVNMRGAAANDMPVGVYFFSRAANEVEAVEEASAVLRLIREYKLEYPVFIDAEGVGGNGRTQVPDADTRTLICEAFCRTVKNAGYDAGVYGSRNWFDNNLEMDRLQDYSIWLAEYRSVPLYKEYYNMWQHTSQGKIDGISGNVDMNVSYGNAD